MLRKKTQILRETVVQEARVILPPEHDAPPGSVRRVQVLIPPSPTVFMDEDVTPEELGPNKNYKMPTMAPGARLVFYLLPEQWLVANAAERFANISIVCEYLSGGAPYDG